MWPRGRAAAVGLTEIAVLLGVTGLNGNVTPWDATAAEALAVLGAWGAGEMLRARRQIAAEQAVAHHVSMIAVRAVTVRYSVPDLHEPGRAAFEEIAEEARTALTELRVVLGVLRAPDGSVTGSAPQPRIADLACLVERMTGAGMDVTLRAEGEVRPLSGSTELCCYRVVREALTNAGRHARGSVVQVTVTFREEEISCTIANSTATVSSGAGRAWGSRGSSPFGQHGVGLTGLRERVAMLQGAFEAGPNELGGFTVYAELPPPAPPLARPVDDRARAGRTNALRVLVADDQAVVRIGFTAMLDAQPDLTVVGAAADGRQAVSLAKELHPDVVLMDIRMPVLTTFDLVDYVYDGCGRERAASCSRTPRPSRSSPPCA